MAEPGWWQSWLEFGDALLQSRFALAILLLLAAIGLVVYVRREVQRTRHEMKVAIIQCQRDSLADASFLRTSMGIAHEYRTMMIAVFSGRREPPPELDKLNERFQELRRKIHDDVNERRARLKDSMRRYEVALGQEEGLKGD